MGEKTIIIDFNKLEDGMIVAKNGRVLINKGIVITEQMIIKVQKSYFITNECK